MIHRERSSKYGNVKVPSTKMLDKYTSGKALRSKQEFNHALWLLSELQARRIKNFEYEKSYELMAFCPLSGLQRKVDSIVIGHHKPDFTVTLPDGRTEVHEIKGGKTTKTEAWALRRKLFQANYPHIKYRVFEFGTEHKERVIEWD